MSAYDAVHEQSRRVQPGESAMPQRRRFPVLLTSAMIVGWFFLIRRFGEGDVYGAVGPYALAVALVCLLLRPRELGARLRPRKRSVALGLCVGVAMTGLTYPLYWLVSGLHPPLDRTVQNLYRGAHATSFSEALAWVLAIILAEELLYRGVWLEQLRVRMSMRSAGLLSVLAYAFAQAGTGSWLVALMAAVCGGVWTVQRWYTDSLLSPLIAHLIWTPTVILLHPVT